MQLNEQQQAELEKLTSKLTSIQQQIAAQKQSNEYCGSRWVTSQLSAQQRQALLAFHEKKECVVLAKIQAIIAPEDAVQHSSPSAS